MISHLIKYQLADVELREKNASLTKETEFLAAKNSMLSEKVTYLESRFDSVLLSNLKDNSTSYASLSAQFRAFKLKEDSENSVVIHVGFWEKVKSQCKQLFKIKNSQFSEAKLNGLDSISDLTSLVVKLVKFAHSGVSSEVLSSQIRRRARDLLKVNVELAKGFADIAIMLDQRTQNMIWYCAFLYDAGDIVGAEKTLREVTEEKFISDKQKQKIHKIKLASIFRDIDELRFTTRVHSETLPKRLIYIASSILVSKQSGYTVRTHEILKAYRALGWDVLCISLRSEIHTTNGKKPLPIVKTAELDGIPYVEYVSFTEPPDYFSIVHYYKDGTAFICDQIRNQKASVVVAASNFENATPALLAARENGVRFVYEVRGLWEHTRDSKLPNWSSSEHFRIMHRAESFVAGNADLVLTQNMALGKEMVSRGINSEKIVSLPNGIAPATLSNSESKQYSINWPVNDSDFVVGYIGSVVEYEGLIFLCDTLLILKDSIPNLKLVIFGKGPYFRELEKHIKANQMEEYVFLMGQIPKQYVELAYDRIDVVVNPRLNHKVTRLVSPLKPLEAMLYKTPIIVSDVDAMKELVTDGVTGLTFKTEDSEDLMNKLKEVNAHSRKITDCIKTAFNRVIKERNWFTIVGDAQDSVLGENVKNGKSPIELLSESNKLSPEAKKLVLEITGRVDCEQKVVSLIVEADALEQAFDKSVLSFLFIRLAEKCAAEGLDEIAWQMVEKSIGIRSNKTNLRSAIKISIDLAKFFEARQFVDEFDFLDGLNENDKKIIRLSRSALQITDICEQPKVQLKESSDVKVLYVLAFSLPHSSVGYSTRSHGILKGMQNHSSNVIAYTRPGFPESLIDNGQLDLRFSDTVDGITYNRCLDIDRRNYDEMSYIAKCADYWEAVINEQKPTIVQAGSNYVTALPAFIAARRCGLPFVYEMRGFWEVTRSSRDESFRKTRKYRHMVYFENLVARNASSVMAITSAMKRQLIERGVSSETISIAFNGTDPNRFLPRPKSTTLLDSLGIDKETAVIGYIGSLVDYEGLDDLLMATKALSQSELNFKVLIVGDGERFESLQQTVVANKLSDYVIFTGRVSHEEVEDYYSLVDIAPFPRKPWEVCELVSPLKPFEAMAMEKAVLVSSTEALSEIVTDMETGLVFNKGSIKSLEDKLRILIEKPDLRKSLGKQARLWVKQNRTWNNTAMACLDAINNKLRP